MQINADLHPPGKFILYSIYEFNIINFTYHIKFKKKKSLPPGGGGGAKILSYPGVKFLDLLMIHM